MSPGLTQLTQEISKTNGMIKVIEISGELLFNFAHSMNFPPVFGYYVSYIFMRDEELLCKEMRAGVFSCFIQDCMCHCSVLQDLLERQSRSITRPDRTWLNCRAASREILPTPQLSCWSWPITRPLEGRTLIPQETTL